MKREVKEDIQNLQKQKKISEEEASYANELRDAALENEKTTVTELREYSNFKAELRGFGLSSSTVDEPRKLVRVIYGIKQRGYDVDKVLSEYSDIEFMQVKRDMLSTQVRTLEDKIVNLQSQYSFLESQVNLHRQLLRIYDELNLMGFGLRELNILYNRINEISAEYKIFGYKALVNEFFEFLEQRYNIKLRQKVHNEYQHQKTQLSKSFIYKKTTAFPKTSEEQSDQLTDGNNSDERYGSDDDHLL